jgi:hypothetical protein
MSNVDAIPSWGDAVVALIYLRDTPNPAPPPDRLDAMGARR